MKLIKIAEQGSLMGSSKFGYRNQFDLPLTDLRSMVLAQQVECYICGRRFRPKGRGFLYSSITIEEYQSPWDDISRTIDLCSDKCEEEYAQSDWAAWICVCCDRYIVQRCPRNGWHSYFKEIDNELICLACYEKDILENGCPNEDFEGDTIKGGMFFSWDNQEPKNRGWEEAFTMFVGSPSDAIRFNSHARRYIDSSNKCLIGYERMAIGGLEGTITLFIKKTTKKLLTKQNLCDMTFFGIKEKGEN